MKKLKKYLKFTALIVFIFCIAGYIVENIYRNRDLKLHPAPGEFINLDKYKLHVNVSGSGKLPVIILAGSGSSSYEWDVIAAKLNNFTQVVRYDRAGYAWSDLPDKNYTLDSTMINLKTIIAEKNIHCPCVLIGHSLGGLYARVFQYKFPSLVAGMILVDARPDNFATEIPEFTKLENLYAKLIPVLKVSTALGISRLFRKSVLPDNYPESYLSFKCTVDLPKNLSVLKYDLSNLKSMDLILSKAKFKKVPTIIITHGKDGTYFGNSKLTKLIESKWKKIQVAMALKYGSDNVVVAENSGHNIHLDAPSVIVHETQKLMQRLKG